MRLEVNNVPHNCKEKPSFRCWIWYWYGQSTAVAFCTEKQQFYQQLCNEYNTCFSWNVPFRRKAITLRLKRRSVFPTMRDVTLLAPIKVALIPFYLGQYKCRKTAILLVPGIVAGKRRWTKALLQWVFPFWIASKWRHKSRLDEHRRKCSTVVPV